MIFQALVFRLCLVAQPIGCFVPKPLNTQAIVVGQIVYFASHNTRCQFQISFLFPVLVEVAALPGHVCHWP